MVMQYITIKLFIYKALETFSPFKYFNIQKKTLCVCCDNIVFLTKKGVILEIQENGLKKKESLDLPVETLKICRRKINTNEQHSIVSQMFSIRRIYYARKINHECYVRSKQLSLL